MRPVNGSQSGRGQPHSPASAGLSRRVVCRFFRKVSECGCALPLLVLPIRVLVRSLDTTLLDPGVLNLLTSATATFDLPSAPYKKFYLNHCQISRLGVKVDQQSTAMGELALHLEQKPESSASRFPNANTPLLILHVDDDAKDHALFKAASHQANVPISWQHINSASGAISYLQRLSKTSSPAWPNLILLDIAMPGETGLKVLEYACAKPEFKKLPIIVFSGSKDPRVTARAGLLGAKSVIAKPSNFEEAIQLIGSIYNLFSISIRPDLPAL